MINQTVYWLSSGPLQFPKLPFGPVGWMLAGVLVLSVIVSVVEQSTKGKKKRRKKRTSTTKKTTVPRRNSNDTKPDEAILASKLSDLSGAEFERLLALYFRDQGYTVHEVGVGGNDGGVDLVIIDRRGEKTAVQAKCYADHNSIPVQTVRELVAAKRNHDCILSLLITTSDLTGPAKKEAEQFKVDYWHGALLEQKLRAWGKWQPSKKPRLLEKRAEIGDKSEVVKAWKEASATASITCKCGSPMVRRKSKNGEEFLGCSRFPSCRHTKTLQDDVPIRADRSKCSIRRN
ncbi:restriction endonuclease [Paenibacillus oleatilyticus]|uniref:Restriction endonuclease n=1 Tax=Paenibacillus oleatilyticus TaxID=2594886 RepID=A0ABV4VBN6_9BACL